MGTLKAVMMSFMVLALHSCCTSGVSSKNNELLSSVNNLPSSKTLSQSTATQSAVNKTAAAEEMMKSVELLTDNMVAESSTATATEQVVESNSFNKKSGSVPRKGAAKEPVKGRKGVTSFPGEGQEKASSAVEEATSGAPAVSVTNSTSTSRIDDTTTTTTTTTPVPPAAKSKPTASETERSEDEEEPGSGGYTALIVGLSLGISLVLILVFVTYWRMKDVWERRQYKRVDRDFLIDGLYSDA